MCHFFTRFLERLNYKGSYRGNYTSWEEAELASTGYDTDIILNKVKHALLKVKNGEAVYERDSVVFDEIQYSWPLLAGLLWIASCNRNQLNLIDLGGSLGSSFFQNKQFLNHLDKLSWSVVEQKTFVDCGRESFEDNVLKFYYALDECIAERSPDTILFGSVIQYLEKPYEVLQEVINIGFKYLIFDRTPFFTEGNDRLTVQKVPAEIYKASYPAWFFNQDKFLNFFTPQYELINDFECNDRANIPSTFKGFIFRRR